MATVRRTPRAEVDLDAILADLNLKDPAIAERYATEFEKKGQALALFPEMGRKRPELAPGLRSILVQPYLLFYRIVGDEVQVVRILHGKQDLRRILRNEGD